MNPLQFYAEAIPKNMDHVEITDINEQYLSEFLEALQSAINQMSADGTRISFVTSKASELGRYMAKCLDESWNQMRGMEVQSVGIAAFHMMRSLKELINTRNEGAMLSDPSIAQGYMVKNMSEGVKNAGSNSGGAMQGFMGVGMGMSTMGNMMNGFTQMAQNNRSAGMNAPGNGAAGMAAGVASGATQQRMRQAGHVSADRKTQVNSAVIAASLCHRRLQSGHVSVDRKIQVNSAQTVASHYL